MKTLEETKRLLEEWHRSDTVGSLMLYRYPKSQLIETIEETVVKVGEMPADVAEAFVKFMDYYKIERGEVIRSTKNGKPDRVKYTRRLDV